MSQTAVQSSLQSLVNLSVDVTTFTTISVNLSQKCNTLPYNAGVILLFYYQLIEFEDTRTCFLLSVSILFYSFSTPQKIVPTWVFRVKRCQTMTTVTVQSSGVREAICAHYFVHSTVFRLHVNLYLSTSLSAILLSLALWIKWMLMSYNSTEVYQTWNEY